MPLSKDEILDAIVRGEKRRGLPPNADAQDLRQEGLLALIGVDGDEQARHLTARKAIRNALHQIQALNTRLCTGMLNTSGDLLDSQGNPSRLPATITGDPFFTHRVDRLEKRHRAWESDRAKLWGSIRGRRG
jgi:hypothetical protein